MRTEKSKKFCTLWERLGEKFGWMVQWVVHHFASSRQGRLRRGWWAENSWALFFPDLMIPPVKYRLRNPFFASAHVWYQCIGIQQWSQSISKVLESKNEKYDCCVYLSTYLFIFGSREIIGLKLKSSGTVQSIWPHSVCFAFVTRP